VVSYRTLLDVSRIRNSCSLELGVSGKQTARWMSRCDVSHTCKHCGCHARLLWSSRSLSRLRKMRAGWRHLCPGPAFHDAKRLCRRSHLETVGRLQRRTDAGLAWVFETLMLSHR
jgi:hypothetical protein